MTNAMSRRTLWYNSMQENNLAMAVAALPVSLKEPTKADTSEGIRLMRVAPYKPRIVYKEDSGVPPGFRVCDLKAMTHPDDFKWLMKDVEPCGELDGEPIIWALDYIRWVIREEER